MAANVNHRALRQHLIKLLSSEGAHLDLEDALRGLPPKLRGQRPPKQPHSIWELLEHMRIAQWDILEFSRNPKHNSPKWPEGYWPRTPAPLSAKAWSDSIKHFERDREAMKQLVRDAKTDLFAKIPHGEGQTILREALLVADHNAYHVGEIVSVRQALGAWK
jgi:hypothetical protein